ncbi:MAG TPA: hypothetical protein VHL53_24060 [Acidimicrobiia bacterium]|nr:hypothetical protein [Acidimicrobiia bacterium]
MAVAETIICVDCGGLCQRWPVEPPELGWAPGDVVAYRCRDCADVWYLEVVADDLTDEDGEPPV